MSIYKLPVSYETNIPYAENEEQNKGGFLPNVDAIRIHVAEALVEFKKKRDSINLNLPDINTIQESLSKTFKDTGYENLFAMHDSIPYNVRRMFEYTWLANELGIMKGDAEGYFLPYNRITRAELITIIDRIIEE